MQRLRVVIADDHALLAEGIASVLRPTCDIIGFCRDGRQMLEIAANALPDVMVFDIGMPGMNGLEAARRIHAAQPGILLVCITQQTTLPYLRAAFEAGASAFIAKQAALVELEEAFRRITRGQRFVTSSLREIYEDARFDWNGPGQRDAGQPLTPRRREVLQLVAEGKQNKEIASALDISTKTVEYHRAAIMKTLGLRSTAELTRYAVSRGLTNGDL